MARKKISGMPEVQLPEDKREELAVWMKSRFEEIEDEAQARAEILRTVGEHPSPLFARLVRKWAGLGIVKTHIAKLLDIGYGTLVEHYGEDIELGIAETNALVAASMLKIASDPFNPGAGKVGMQWLERRGGEPWKPPAQKLEVQSADKSPPIIDSSKMTYEERQRMRTMLERIAAGGEGEPIQPDEQDPVIE